jgi:hypothetical protein
MFRTAKSRLASTLWICVLVLVVAPAGAAPRALADPAIPLLTQLVAWWETVWSWRAAPVDETAAGAETAQAPTAEPAALSTGTGCVTAACRPVGWEFEPWG